MAGMEEDEERAEEEAGAVEREQAALLGLCLLVLLGVCVFIF